MRNNEERMGASQHQLEGGDEILLEKSKLDLDFVTPTEFVDLPSKGKFYSKEHPLYNQESVEIRYMTAAEEDVLNSKSLLRKGIAIERFLQKIILDKKIKVDSLLVGDKNAIIIASRITGYGSEYETTMVCPNCGEKVKHEFNLSSSKISYCNEESLKKANASLTEENTLLITLPKTKWIVELKFLTGEDEKWLSSSEESKKKNNLPEKPLTDLFRRIILSINGNKDQNVINKAVDSLPSLDSKYLRVSYQHLSPNVDLTQNFSCFSCGTEQEVRVPFGPEFFWPDR